MIIASRLSDGAVVFLGEDETWTTSIDGGAVAEDASGGERLLSVAKEHEAGCLVTDPYLIDIEVDASRRRPVSIREAIRAFGPTVKTYAGAER
jgi:hypothetical protein